MESVDSLSEASNEIEKVCRQEVSNLEKLAHTKSEIVTAETVEPTKHTSDTQTVRQRAHIKQSALVTSKTKVRALHSSRVAR
jgi:hypothetical protein